MDSRGLENDIGNADKRLFTAAAEKVASTGA